MHSEHTQHLLGSLSDKHQTMTYAVPLRYSGASDSYFYCDASNKRNRLRDRSRFLINSMHLERRRKLSRSMQNTRV